MFSTWFLVSLGLLVLSLVACALLRRFPSFTGGAVLVFFCTTMLLAAGMLA